MTIHETAAKIAAVNARIAAIAQTSNDECIRMSARIEGLEALLSLACKYLEHPDVVSIGFAFPPEQVAKKARAILAKGN